MGYRDSDFDPNRTVQPPTLGFPTAREILAQKEENAKRNDEQAAAKAENFLNNNKKVILETLVAFDEYVITKKQYLALFQKSNDRTEIVFFSTIRDILEPLGYRVAHNNYSNEVSEETSTLATISLEEE